MKRQKETLRRLNRTANDKENEQAVLGYILSHGSEQNYLLTEIDTNCFETEQHQLLFRVMKALNSRDIVFDSTILAKEVEKYKTQERFHALSLIDIEYITDMYEKGNISEDVFNGKVTQMKDLHVSDIMNTYFTDAVTSLCDGSATPDKCRDTIIEQLQNIDADGINRISTMDDACDVLADIIDRRHRGELVDVSYLTGFEGIDDATGGFAKKELVTIAAYSACGKTALALSIVKRWAEHNARGMYFSVEMNMEELASRLASMIIADRDLPSRKIYKQSLNAYEYDRAKNAVETLRNYPLYFDDKNSLSFKDMVSSIRRRKGKIDYVVVDYLQAFSNGKSVQEDAVIIKAMAMVLKNLARELNICVIALAQLGRSYIQNNKLPTNEDIYGSSGIMNASDKVVLIHNPHIIAKVNLNVKDEWGVEDTRLTDVPTLNHALLVLGKARDAEGLYQLVEYIPYCTMYRDCDTVPQQRTETIFNEQGFVSQQTVTEDVPLSPPDTPPEVSPPPDNTAGIIKPPPDLYNNPNNNQEDWDNDMDSAF